MQAEVKQKWLLAMWMLIGALFVGGWITGMILLANHSIVTTNRRTAAEHNKPSWGPNSEQEPVKSTVPGQPGAEVQQGKGEPQVTTTTVAPTTTLPKIIAYGYDMPDGVYDVYGACIGENGVYSARGDPAAFVIIPGDPNCTGSTQALPHLPPYLPLP